MGAPRQCAPRKSMARPTYCRSIRQLSNIIQWIMGKVFAGKTAAGGDWNGCIHGGLGGRNWDMAAAI
jgi:hypothetical protein